MLRNTNIRERNHTKKEISGGELLLGTGVLRRKNIREEEPRTSDLKKDLYTHNRKTNEIRRRGGAVFKGALCA